jgi:hypothetical protein
MVELSMHPSVPRLVVHLIPVEELQDLIDTLFGQVGPWCDIDQAWTSIHPSNLLRIICENTMLKAGLVSMESRGGLDLEWAWLAVGGSQSYLADNSTRTSMTIYFIPPYLPHARGRNLPPIISCSQL